MAQYRMIMLLAGFVFSNKATLVVHDPLIKVPEPMQTISQNASQKKFDLSYTPQQVITIKKKSKALPLQPYIYAKGKQYIKCIIRSNSAEQQTKSIELLAQKEPLAPELRKTLQKETLPGHHIIRLYKKTGDAAQKLWDPLLSAPLAFFDKELKNNISMTPEGTLAVLSENA